MGTNPADGQCSLRGLGVGGFLTELPILLHFMFFRDILVHEMPKPDALNEGL